MLISIFQLYTHIQIDPKECNLKNGVRLKRDSNQCKVFVGGLPHDIKEDVLKGFFSEYGKVTEVVIMYDQEKKKTRGKLKSALSDYSR